MSFRRFPRAARREHALSEEFFRQNGSFAEATAHSARPGNASALRTKKRVSGRSRYRGRLRPCPPAPDALLDTYHDERHPVGADLLASTRAQTALMTGHSPEGQALRARLSGLIADLPELSRTLAERLSALSVAYPAGEDDHRLAGTRAPDLRLGGTGLFALLRTGHHVLLDLSGGTPPAEGVTHPPRAALRTARGPGGGGGLTDPSRRPCGLGR
ncbi:hypothetical protein ACIOG8_19405 [Streptomyces erythrochromogenes]|uniref:hypothetical protein n=1 Tax=Streptomyces erythrochromogenes TaxID=285574 RepID=UPI003819DC52